MKYLTTEELRKKYPLNEFGDNLNIPSFVQIGYHVKIGNNVKIGYNVNIYDRVVIGNNVNIADNVKLLFGVNIADNCNIQEYTQYWCSAEIKAGFEGKVFRKDTAYYFNFNSKINDIIVRLGPHHRTISEWENSFNNNERYLPIVSSQWKKRLDDFIYTRDEAIKDYEQKMNKKFDYKLKLGV